MRTSLSLHSSPSHRISNFPARRAPPRASVPLPVLGPTGSRSTAVPLPHRQGVRTTTATQTGPILTGLPPPSPRISVCDSLFPAGQMSFDGLHPELVALMVEDLTPYVLKEPGQCMVFACPGTARARHFHIKAYLVTGPATPPPLFPSARPSISSPFTSSSISLWLLGSALHFLDFLLCISPPSFPHTLPPDRDFRTPLEFPRGYSDRDDPRKPHQGRRFRQALPLS